MTLPAANLLSGNYFYASDGEKWQGTLDFAPQAITLLTIDYSVWLAPGDAVASVLLSEVSGTLSLPQVSVINSGEAISFTVGAGLASGLYELDVFVTTSAGIIKEDRFRIRVFAPSVQVGTAYQCFIVFHVPTTITLTVDTTLITVDTTLYTADKQ